MTNTETEISLSMTEFRIKPRTHNRTETNNPRPAIVSRHKCLCTMPIIPRSQTRCIDFPFRAAPQPHIQRGFGIVPVFLSAHAMQPSRFLLPTLDANATTPSSMQLRNRKYPFAVLCIVVSLYCIINAALLFLHRARLPDERGRDAAELDC